MEGTNSLRKHLNNHLFDLWRTSLVLQSNGTGCDNFCCKCPHTQELMRSLQGSRFAKELLVGAVAGAISRTVTAPVDRLRIVMQAATSETKNMGAYQAPFR